MSPSKKGGKTGSSKAKSATKAPAFSPANHGLITVDQEYPLAGLLLEVSPGEYVWNPQHTIQQVGALVEFAPLSSRSHVRLSFVCSLEVHFAPRVGQPSRTAKKWSSGWIAVDDFVLFKLRAFGKDAPTGFWRVESAGLRQWEGDASAALSPITQAHIDKGRVGVSDARRLRTQIARAAADDEDDD
jgi:hypothetical protein